MKIPNLKDGIYTVREKFIKENRPCLYTAKIIDGTWLAYLSETDALAKEMIELVIKSGITEDINASDQSARVSAMEQIKHIAEEFALKNIIYSFNTYK